METIKTTGLDYSNMDLTVRPGDDFFRYATGNWIQNNPQPPIFPSWGSFVKLDDDNTKQIAELIQKELNPKGVAVVLEASRMCMTMRGVKKPGATMVTTQLLGRFKTDEKTRAEFMSRIYAPR